MMISIFRNVLLSHFERRRNDFIESLSFRRLWRRSGPSRLSGRKTPAGQFWQTAVPWLFAGPATSGGWDGWLHRKGFPATWARQRNVSSAGFVSRSAMLIHSWYQSREVNLLCRSFQPRYASDNLPLLPPARTISAPFFRLGAGCGNKKQDRGNKSQSAGNKKQKPTSKAQGGGNK